MKILTVTNPSIVILITAMTLILCLLSGCKATSVPANRFVGTWVDVGNANIEYEISKSAKGDYTLTNLSTSETILMTYEKGVMTLTDSSVASTLIINNTDLLVIRDGNENVISRARRK